MCVINFEIRFMSLVEKRCSDVIKIEVARQCNTFKEFSPVLPVGTENMHRKSDWLSGTDQIRQIGRFNWNFDTHTAVLSRVITGINATMTFQKKLSRLDRSIVDKPRNLFFSYSKKKQIFDNLFSSISCSSIFTSYYFLLLSKSVVPDDPYIFFIPHDWKIKKTPRNKGDYMFIK